MFHLAFLFSLTLPFGAGLAASSGGAGDAAGGVEELVKAYCGRHGLARDKLEVWKAALAPEGRVFRYKLAAVAGKEKRDGLPERYAFVFVDPASGNVYDVKRMPGGDTTLDQRTFAVLRLMGTKVKDRKHAAALMVDLWRMRDGLERAGGDDPGEVHLERVTKRETRIDPPTTYHGTHAAAPRVELTADEEGYVTGFLLGNIR